MAAGRRVRSGLAWYFLIGIPIALCVQYPWLTIVIGPLLVWIVASAVKRWWFGPYRLRAVDPSGADLLAEEVRRLGRDPAAVEALAGERLDQRGVLSPDRKASEAWSRVVGAAGAFLLAGGHPQTSAASYTTIESYEESRGHYTKTEVEAHIAVANLHRDAGEAHLRQREILHRRLASEASLARVLARLAVAARDQGITERLLHR